MNVAARIVTLGICATDAKQVAKLLEISKDELVQKIGDEMDKRIQARKNRLVRAERNLVEKQKEFSVFLSGY